MLRLNDNRRDGETGSRQLDFSIFLIGDPGLRVSLSLASDLG